MKEIRSDLDRNRACWGKKLMEISKLYAQICSLLVLELVFQLDSA